MDIILTYLKNLGMYFLSIHANAFWTIVYYFTQNAFVIVSLIMIIWLCMKEVQMDSLNHIDDKRKIY